MEGLISSHYSEVLGLAACIGLMHLNDWLERRKIQKDEKPKEYENFKHYQFEQRMERRRKAKERDLQQKNHKAVELQ